jgi:hypothetical protein
MTIGSIGPWDIAIALLPITLAIIVFYLIYRNQSGAGRIKFAAHSLACAYAAYVLSLNAIWMLNGKPQVVRVNYDRQDHSEIAQRSRKFSRPIGVSAYSQTSLGAKRLELSMSMQHFQLPQKYYHEWCSTSVIYLENDLVKCFSSDQRCEKTSRGGDPHPAGVVSCESSKVPRWCVQWWDGLRWRDSAGIISNPKENVPPNVLRIGQGETNNTRSPEPDEVCAVTQWLWY